MFPLLISDQSPKHLTDGKGRKVDPGTNAHLEEPQPSIEDTSIVGLT